MPRLMDQSVVPCEGCGDQSIPNLRLERRIAYRRTGETPMQKGGIAIHEQQDVLVCLKCGVVQELLKQVAR